MPLPCRTKSNLLYSDEKQQKAFEFHKAVARHMEYTSAIQSQAELSRPRPRVHEYVFIENDIVFNENATILLHPYIVFVSFHIVLICPHENDENGKNQRKSIISYRIVSYRIEIIWIICGCCCIVFKSLHFQWKRSVYWWLAYDVIKNMIMKIMINLLQILIWPTRPYNVFLY